MPSRTRPAQQTQAVDRRMSYGQNGFASTSPPVARRATHQGAFGALQLLALQRKGRGALGTRSWAPPGTLGSGRCAADQRGPHRSSAPRADRPRHAAHDGRVRRRRAVPVTTATPRNARAVPAGSHQPRLLWEVRPGLGAPNAPRSRVIRPCCLLGRVKGAQPHPLALGGVSDLRGPLAPRPLSHAAVLQARTVLA